MADVKIIGCMIQTSRRYESAPNIKKILPFVDRFILIDGGSQEDESVVFFRNLAKRNPKFELYINPFSYDFVAQRNIYLDKAKKYLNSQDETWVLVVDSDEVPTLAFLNRMRDIVSGTSKLDGNVIALRCRSVWTEGGDIVRSTLDDFWKVSMVKLYPETRYEGTGHEHINQPNMKIVTCGDDRVEEDFEKTIQYLNYKEVNGSLWIRGFRNFSTWGGGKNLYDKNPYYVEWKKIISPYFDNVYPKFDEQLEWFAKGNLPWGVKDWLLNSAMLCRGFEGDSEVREVVKSYYGLYHPEELPSIYTVKQIEDL